MRRLSRTSLAVMAGAASIAFVAGCGGGDDAATTAAPDTAAALTAAAYREQADGICERFNAQSDAVAEPTSPAAVGPYLEALLPINRAQLAELEALRPPAELAGAHGQAMDLLRRQLAAAEAATDRISGGEDATAVVTEVGPEIEALSAQADARARELGLTVCGNDDEEDTDTGGGAATAP